MFTRYDFIFIAAFAALSACSSSSTTTSSTDGGGGGGADAGGGTGEVSAACTKDLDCQSGLYCSTGDPGGQCLKVCHAQSECPMGSTCTDENKCYKTCTGKTDCPRDGYACVDSTKLDMSAGKTCDIAPPADAGGD